MVTKLMAAGGEAVVGLKTGTALVLRTARRLEEAIKRNNKGTYRRSVEWGFELLLRH